MVWDCEEHKKSLKTRLEKEYNKMLKIRDKTPHDIFVLHLIEEKHTQLVRELEDIKEEKRKARGKGLIK